MKLPSESRMQRAWDALMTDFFDPKTNLIYQYLVSDPDGFPTPEEAERAWPNPGGHGTGMEDSMIDGGTMLDAALCRYEKTGDKDAADLAAKLADGLVNCAKSAKTEGYIPRSVTPADGKSHYPDTSRDQYTMFCFGLYRYLGSDLCTDAQRDAIAQVLVGVARRCEKNMTPETGYNLLRDDGGLSNVSVMWGDTLVTHEFCRLPMLYIAAWKASGDPHWFAMYEAVRAEAIEGSTPIKRVWRLYAMQQMQSALYVCYDAEPDASWKDKWLQVMHACADYVLDPVRGENLSAGLNTHGLPPSTTVSFRDMEMVERHYPVWAGLPEHFPVVGPSDIYLLQDPANRVLIASLVPGREIPEEVYGLYAETFEKMERAAYRGTAVTHYLEAYYRVR